MHVALLSTMAVHPFAWVQSVIVESQAGSDLNPLLSLKPPPYTRSAAGFPFSGTASMDNASRSLESRYDMAAPILPLVEAAALWPARGALIGLDLGTKTIGVAVSDPDRRVATGVETIARKKFTGDAARILALARERTAVGLVLGLPINMDGSEGPRAQATRAFAGKPGAARRAADRPVG